MKSATPLSRRTFIRAASGALGAGALAVSGPASPAGERKPVPLGQEPDFLVVDSHLHLFQNLEENERILEQCTNAGIDRVCAFLSGAVSTGAVADNPNQAVKDLRRRHPRQVIAFARCDGHEGRKAVDALTRLVEEHDFRGLKQSFNVRASDPAIFPLVERAIELKVPILFHTFMDKERRPERDVAYPGETSALELVGLARRYPEATIIMAHYNLGDWEYGLKAVKETPNIYLSTGGSGLDADYIEAGVREVGAGRFVFGTDNTICGSMAKLLNARITDDQRRTIFSRNLCGLLTRRGPLE